MTITCCGTTCTIGFLSCMGGFICLLGISSLGVGIVVLGGFEAYYISKSVSLQGQCCNVWEWMLAATICNLLFGLCGLLEYVNKADENQEHSKKSKLDKMIEFGNRMAGVGKLVIGVWACYTVASQYSCQMYWQHLDPNLWFLVKLEVIAFAILVSCVLVLAALCLCGATSGIAFAVKKIMTY